MYSYLVLAVLGLLVAFAISKYRQFAVNLAAAKQSGIPYIWTPVYVFDRFWLITHRLWMPFIKRLPKQWTQEWIDYVVPEFTWDKMYDAFRDIGADVFIIVSPTLNHLWVADPEAVNQITTRRNDFPKPTEIYRGLDIYGKNVISSEGSVWRHHRKITSPPFTEKNNRLVWLESLHQAQSMVTGWIGQKDAPGTVWDVAGSTMRLSLHVISKAGFGVGLVWPHEEGGERNVPDGHTLTYKDALSGLLENLITVILTPKWLLARSPLKLHKEANEAYVEWGKYMSELYQEKRKEIGNGDTHQGMDLMGALVKGAGITVESSYRPSSTAPEKAISPANKQLLTDDEILGNAFVFIIAGHETAANTIHFSLMFLAMHPESQRHLQKELDEILGDREMSEWNYDEDVPKLFGSMCGAVMNETLRLIPPAIWIPKCVPKDSPQGLQIGGRRVTVPQGCQVALDIAALHRHPKYWPHTSEEDLQEFRPERWLLDTAKGANHATDQEAYAAEEGLEFDGPDKRADTSASLFRPPKGAYVPFSDGYRSCLGRRFAQVEILAVLAVIFKTWSVELDVSTFMSDEEFKLADEQRRREAWNKADTRTRWLLRHGMMTMLTIQMRGGKVPMRFVKRGNERFRF